MTWLPRLEGFFWVARTGGYARAARAFPYPITQPGVHQQVSRLERDLGVVLFERAGRDQVLLTAAGRALYEYVAPFLEGLPAAVQAVQQGKHGGRLRIAAAAMVVRQLLPPWLRRLQARWPNIQVVLSELKNADPTVLRRGEADMLVDHIADVPADLETQRVGTVRPFVVLPAAHRHARKRGLKLADLRDDVFISYSTDRTHRELQLRALSLHRVSPRESLSVDTSESILAFVAAGLGFSLVPSLQPKGPRVAGVTAHPLGRPSAEFPVFAAWRKTTLPNPLLAAALAVAPGP